LRAERKVRGKVPNEFLRVIIVPREKEKKEKEDERKGTG
jgi:hypothetical protein